MMNNCRLFALMVAALVSGCSTTSSTGYHRQCGESSDGSRGRKIVTRAVELKGIPDEKTYYLAAKQGSYAILLKPEDLLRYLEHYLDPAKLRDQVKSDLPLKDFTDLNKYMLTNMIEDGRSQQGWGRFYVVAEMLENGDATVIDLINDRNRHGLIRKITVANVISSGGESREFCINDDDNFNTGWPIYYVTDVIND